MRADELKACPFCGGVASIEEIGSGDRVRFSVGCADENGDCYGYQSLTNFSRRTEAITAWNTRVSTPSVVGGEEQGPSVAESTDAPCSASSAAAGDGPCQSEETDDQPEPPWPAGSGHNGKRAGWKGFFSARGREECPFPPNRRDLRTGYEEGWDAAWESITPTEGEAS